MVAPRQDGQTARSRDGSAFATGVLGLAASVATSRRRRAAMTGQPVVDYYDSCGHHYPLMWHDAASQAMHFGYHDREVAGHADALQRMNGALADAAQIRPGERVLDAGCGTGGSTMWLARHRQVEAVGISLVGSQVGRARRHALHRGVAGVDFAVRDFAATGWRGEGFDVVWALEAFCHAPDKAAALREWGRLLSPGGRIVIGDGFVANDRARTDTRLQRMCTGWALPGLASEDEVGRWLREAGLVDIRVRDITAHVMPSSRRMWAVASWFRPPAQLLVGMGRMTHREFANVDAAIAQHGSLRRGAWRYMLVTARKPSRGGQM